MKIYNEITSIFNDTTGQWETISEDSYEYGGPVALAQGLPPSATPILDEDVVADTLKVTAGYFTGGDGTIEGSIIHTGSLSDSNEKYYYNVTQAHPASASAVTQFSVTFGHIEGSGSNTLGDSNANANTLNGETEAIYKQFSSLLQEETEAINGFKISQQGSTLNAARVSGDIDKYIYVLVGKRERFKDRINKKAWTLVLSGSNSVGDGAYRELFLTDDSKYVAGVATPGGPRYNIISGTLGEPWISHSAAQPVHTQNNAFTAYRTFGWFYPEMGCMVFSGHELSASIPGISSGTSQTASFDASGGDLFKSSSGFAPNETVQRTNSKNALRFVNCMRNVNGATLRLRSEEDQTQESYFCRIKAQNYNFSSNPTFVSGSLNKIRNITMHGNPQTFITGVGLYNANGQLLATARLSSPLKKNFASEATIKVKLTY